MDVGEKIKRARKTKGYSLNDLAVLMDVNKATISKWENGLIKDIGRGNLQKLATILGIEPTEFFTEVHNNPDNVADMLVKITSDRQLMTVILEYESLSPQKQAQVREYVHLLATAKQS